MIHIDTYGNNLSISRFNERGIVEIEKFKIPDSELYEWQQSDAPTSNKYTQKNWYGESVIKVPTKRLSEFRVQEYMESNPNVFSKYKKYNFPNVWYCDIETAFVNGSYSKPEDATNPILSIALVSSTGAIIALGTQQLKSQADLEKNIKEHLKDIYKNVDSIKVKYMHFNTEYEMMYTFFGEFLPKIGCLTGWNFMDYDWTYLANRAMRLGIDPKIASPAKKFYNKKTMIPLHKLIFDYLDIFKKWDKTLKVKENFQLDYISQQLFGIQKVKYADSLHHLYTKDYDKFIYYNIVDTFLVKLIEDKTKLLAILIKLSNNALVPIERGFSPVAMTQSHYNREFLKRNSVFTPKSDKKALADTEATKDMILKGAYVSTVAPGVYEYVVCFDYSSLYPSIMRQWNISVDTFVGDVNAIEYKEGYAKCAPGYYYDNTKDSVARTVITKLFRERKDIQKIWKSIDAELKELNDELKELTDSLI